MASSAVEPAIAANVTSGPQKKTRQTTLNSSLRLTGVSTNPTGTGASKPGPSAFASILSLPPSTVTREKLRDVENDVEILLSAHKAGHIPKRFVDSLAEVQCPSCDAWVKSNAGKTVRDLVKASHFHNLRTHRASVRCAAARVELKEGNITKTPASLSFPTLSSDASSKPDSQIQQPLEHTTLPRAPSSRRSSVHISEPASTILMDYDLGDDFQPWRSRKSPERELLPHEYPPDRDPFAEYDNLASPRTSLHPDQPYLLMNGPGSVPELSPNFHDSNSQSSPSQELMSNTIAPIDTHTISLARQPLSASDAILSSALSEHSNPPFEPSAEPTWPEDISLSDAIASTRLALEELFTVYTASLDPPLDNSSIIGDASEPTSAQTRADIAPSISADLSASASRDLSPSGAMRTRSSQSKFQSQSKSHRRKSTASTHSSSPNASPGNTNSGSGLGPCLGVPIVWPAEAGPFFSSFPFSRLSDDSPDALPFTLELADSGKARLARSKTCKGVAAPRSGPKCRQCASVKYAVARLAKEVMASGSDDDVMGSDEDRDRDGNKAQHEEDSGEDGEENVAQRAKLRDMKHSVDTVASQAPSEPQHQHRQSSTRDRRHSAANIKLQQSASTSNLRRRDAHVDTPSAHLRDRRQSTGTVSGAAGGGTSLKRKDQASESTSASAPGGRKVARRS